MKGRNEFLHWGQKEHQGSSIACEMHRKEIQKWIYNLLPHMTEKTPILFGANYEQAWEGKWLGLLEMWGNMLSSIHLTNMYEKIGTKIKEAVGVQQGWMDRSKKSARHPTWPVSAIYHISCSRCSVHHLCHLYRSLCLYIHMQVGAARRRRRHSRAGVLTDDADGSADGVRGDHDRCLQEGGAQV